MSLSASFIESLDFDPECKEALSWLARNAPKYPPSTYTPSMTKRTQPSKPKEFLSCWLRIGRARPSDSGVRITRIDAFDGSSTTSCAGTSAEIAASFARTVLRSINTGRMIVTTGQRRRALEVFLDSIGRELLGLGYSLLPCAGSQGVQFVTIRKGKRKWHVVYFETMTGVSLSTGESLATAAQSTPRLSTTLAQRIYTATSAVQEYLLRWHGVALNLTAGITAMQSARRHLPDDLKKWRPTPLLVAMERAGRGYRGGMTYATRYRGPSWRIDVNRQYTAALRTSLPWKVAMGHYLDSTRTPHGIFMCRLQLSDALPYPIGVWSGPERGFVASTVGRGTYVCCLHTSEFPGLLASGAIINPTYGFIYTSTFDLSGFVDSLQTVIDTFGKDSPEGRLTKPLGNYVYGKFGQNPTRTELLYSLADPGSEWFPYWDENGDAHEELWDRKRTRYTASQHVDIAGTITGAARSQTVEMWQSLTAAGATVVRCHTDSLTVDVDPSSVLELSDQKIGAWRLERHEVETVIVGANAYFDRDGAHIAGVSEPTFEMIERMYDGQVVHISQDVHVPLRSSRRGTVTVDRRYKANARR